jgi:hypothetical protein
MEPLLHITSLLMSVIGLKRGSQYPHPKSKFTPEEDNHLVELVEQFGLDSWPQLSRRMPGRNSRQCRDRWVNYLSPDICKGPWCAAEETLLCEKIIEFGHSWKKIAYFFKGRSEVNVKSHWNRMQRRALQNLLEAGRNRLIDAETAITPSGATLPLDLPRLPYPEDDLYSGAVDLSFIF